MFYLKYGPHIAISLFSLSLLAFMEGVVNVEWYGQDYLHLKWHVVCSGLATPALNFSAHFQMVYLYIKHNSKVSFSSIISTLTAFTKAKRRTIQRPSRVGTGWRIVCSKTGLVRLNTERLATLCTDEDISCARNGTNHCNQFLHSYVVGRHVPLAG